MPAYQETQANNAESSSVGLGASLDRSGLRSIVALTLGFALLDIWCDMLGHCSALAPASQLVQEAVTNSRVFWSLSLVFACGAMVLAPERIERASKLLSVIATLASAAGTAAYAASFYMGGGAVLAITSVLVTGVCYGWFEIRLFCQAARLARFSDIVWVLAASRVVKTVVAAIVGSYAVEAQIAADVAAAVALGVLVGWMDRTACWGRSSTAPSRSWVPRVDQVTMIAFLLMYPALNAVARALSTLGFWGTANIIDATSIAVSLPASGLFLVLVYLSFSRCWESEVLGRFVRALILLLGCLVLLDEQMLSAVGMPEMAESALATVAELFSHFLFFLIAVAAVRSLEWPALRAAAMSELVMSSAALVFGLTLQGFSGIGRTIVVVAMYGVVVGVLALLWRSREASRRASDMDGLELSCARIAQERGLSPREAEVLVLLAQGRSRAFIREELVISDSTVKSHINHVYQKLEVHSKQELISLIRS